MLIVRSASEDLTTRARIRDAAIVRFSERGFAGTSLRQIAQDAAVSPALILHHFGSKEGLREACDAHVVNTFLSERDGMTGADASRLMREALDSLEDRNVALDYLAGMLVDDSDASDRLFDTFLASTREMLREQIAAGTMRVQSDLEATAVYMTLYGLGPIILRRHLARAFGESTLTTSLLERSTIPVLELYTHGLYADDRLLVAAKEALSRRSGPRSDKGENDPNQDPDPPR
jgi:AcrR family transcriptional regulator